MIRFHMFVCVCAFPGVSQLPVLLTLLRLFSADINLCNVDGLTALMLAASISDSILVNVSLHLCAITADKEVMFLPLSVVCLSVCPQDNPNSFW